MISLETLNFISNTNFKCKVLTKPKFNFTNLNDSYLECCHGKYEPVFMIVPRTLYNLYKAINNAQFWKQFNASHVFISDDIEANKIAFINIDKISEEKYSALVIFEDVSL